MVAAALFMYLAIFLALTEVGIRLVIGWFFYHQFLFCFQFFLNHQINSAHNAFNYYYKIIKLELDSQLNYYNQNYIIYIAVIYCLIIITYPYSFYTYEIFTTASAHAPAPPTSKKLTILPPIAEEPETTNPLDPDNIFGLQFKYEGGGYRANLFNTLLEEYKAPFPFTEFWIIITRFSLTDILVGIY